MKIVYSKLNCPGCIMLKREYDAKNIEFKEVMIGHDISREDFIAQFPNVKTVPYVVEEENV